MPLVKAQTLVPFEQRCIMMAIFTLKHFQKCTLALQKINVSLIGLQKK